MLPRWTHVLLALVMLTFLPSLILGGEYSYDDHYSHYDQQNGNMNKPSHYPESYDYQYNADYSDYDYNPQHNRQIASDNQISGKESYGQESPKKKVFVPVIVKKKKKKQKIITIQKGVFIPGGVQVFGKFKTLKACMKACGATATCFAGDYNPWLGKCYFHSNGTACDTMQSHKKITHFKKVPCTITDAPRGIIVLGAHLDGGILQKGIEDLVTCSKKCASAGGGIAASPTVLQLGPMQNHDHNQICFGIDYNFATHQCFFHTNLFLRLPLASADGGLPLCPVVNTKAVSPAIDLAANPSTVHMTFCPPGP